MEHGDLESLRLLCAHVVRRLEDDRSVDAVALQLLLDHTPVSVETGRQEEYSEIFHVIEIRQARSKCSFYAAVKHYHDWLQGQEKYTLSPLQKKLYENHFKGVFDQLRKERPPRMKIRDARNRNLRDARKHDA